MFHEIPEPPGEKSEDPSRGIFDASETRGSMLIAGTAIISFIMQTVRLISWLFAVNTIDDERH